MNVSERELVTAAAAGDSAAFARLVRENRDRVEAIVRRLLPREEAEEVTQEALLRAYLGTSTLRDPDRFVGWLCGIAVNLAKMRLRRLALQRRVAVGATGVVVDEDRELLRAVQDAVDLLPAGQRDVVLMHYVDELSCEEIARLLGTTSGAVRVRLHRARAQLRRELAPLAPVRLPTKKEEVAMVEMKVDDVLVRVAADRLEVLGGQRIVVLAEREGDRLLPIWIGAPEGDALALRLSGDSTLRPMTFDLMAELVRAAGGRIDHVTVTALRETTFYATVAVAVDGRTDEVDARPSDAINLAVRVGASILVEDGVLDDHGLARAGLSDKLVRDAESGKLELPPGEWASMSSELLARLHPRIVEERP
jgi:RNA polymerase sigma factor (sigma-70 family)